MARRSYLQQIARRSFAGLPVLSPSALPSRRWESPRPLMPLADPSGRPAPLVAVEAAPDARHSHPGDGVDGATTVHRIRDGRRPQSSADSTIAPQSSLSAEIHPRSILAFQHGDTLRLGSTGVAMSSGCDRVLLASPRSGAPAVEERALSDTTGRRTRQPPALPIPASRDSAKAGRIRSENRDQTAPTVVISEKRVQASGTRSAPGRHSVVPDQEGRREQQRLSTLEVGAPKALLGSARTQAPLPPDALWPANQAGPSPAGATIHIGTIDVHIAPPTLPAQDPPRRGASAPIGTLSRGFASAIGVRQA